MRVGVAQKHDVRIGLEQEDRHGDRQDDMDERGKNEFDEEPLRPGREFARILRAV